jgi:carboxylesterase
MRLEDRQQPRSRYPVMPGAEPWSSVGHGARARHGILVVHGLTGSPLIMRPFAEGLAARGFAVELPRLPGHGTHWRDMASTRYHDWRAAVVTALARLRARCDRVVVTGLSLGGLLTLDVLIAHPREIAGAVVINAQFLDRPGRLARLSPLLARVVPVLPRRLMGLATNDVARPGVDSRSYLLVPTRAGTSVVPQLPRVRAGIGQITCPVLVAYSRIDHSIDPASSRALLAALGARGRELVLERSFHLATLDYDAELLVDRTAAFADQVTGATALAPSPS